MILLNPFHPTAIARARKNNPAAVRFTLLLGTFKADSAKRIKAQIKQMRLHGAALSDATIKNILFTSVLQLGTRAISTNTNMLASVPIDRRNTRAYESS